MFSLPGRGAAPRHARITAVIDGTGILGALAMLLADGYSLDGDVRLLAPDLAHAARTGDNHSLRVHQEVRALQARVEQLARRHENILIDATHPSPMFVRTALIAAHRAVIAVTAEDGKEPASVRLIEEIRLFNPRLQTWLVPVALRPAASHGPAQSLKLALQPGVRLAAHVLRAWRLPEDAAQLYQELRDA